MYKLTFKGLYNIFKLAFKEFKQNEPLRLAGATAFFTTFALPPILIILVQIIGLVFRKEGISNNFFIALTRILGKQGAAQIQVTFKGFTSLAKNGFVAVGGFLFLLFVATTLFKVIKDSMNQLWKVKLRDNKAADQLKGRMTSLVIILIAGFLFVAALLAEGAEAFLHRYTGSWHTLTGSFINILLNQLISVIIVTIWFTVLFKMLPDAKVSWRVSITGGLVTGLLFSAGKILIRTMLTAGNLSTIFGASSSIVLLLLFVFYCSFILYFGACFTKVYAEYVQDPIKAANHAIAYKLVEVSSSENDINAD